MASASCSPPPPLSLSCARALGNRTVSLLPSQCQRCRFGGSSSTFHLQTKKGFRAPNFPLSLRILCTRDHKAEVVTGESWDKLILKSEIPVLVEFYANWCGPCRMVHRVIDEIAIEYAGKLKCFVLNTDHDSQVSENYDIKAVPVVFLFKNGEKRESVVGTMPKEFYVSAIERVLA